MSPFISIRWWRSHPCGKFSLPRVIALPRQDAILGRDVLNQFIVILDGKELDFEITDP
jgi:hypothetical protein